MYGKLKNLAVGNGVYIPFRAPALGYEVCVHPAYAKQGYAVTDNDWFARYKFLQPIGQGGMGTVFLAEDRAQNNATRVIKQMIHKAGDEFERNESVRLFKREAEILRTLDHSGIVKIHDSHVSDDGKYFLVMDYVPGKNLEMIINSKGGALTSDEVVRIAIQCCEVLEYLHGRDEPIIYRDLKPSNLMLTPEGRIIFIDFGIARLMPKEAATRVVTAGYSPPEQYFGRPETRSDLYSLGATMHHLLTGVRPKPLTACDPERVNPTVLPSLNQLVRKMTAHEVQHRPPNAQAVKYFLLKIYKEMHPEFEIPDWEENKVWDERSQVEEAARLKYGRNLSTSSSASSEHPALNRPPSSGNQQALRGGASNARQAGLPGGKTHSAGRPNLTPQSDAHPVVQQTQETVMNLVDRVKRWFENIRR
jgi:serine/threonine protein kinase